MADTKLEMKQSIDRDKRKENLMNMSVHDLWDMIIESPANKYKGSELQNDLAEIILEHDLDLE